MTAVVEVIGLRVSYESDHGERREVLRGLDLAIGAGELVALVGPNGSGKTTLLRAIAGTLARDAGSVAIFGRVKLAERKGWVGMRSGRRRAKMPRLKRSRGRVAYGSARQLGLEIVIGLRR